MRLRASLAIGTLAAAASILALPVSSLAAPPRGGTVVTTYYRGGKPVVSYTSSRRIDCVYHYNPNGYTSNCTR